MRATATLYTRLSGQPYSKVEFKNHKPVVLPSYDGVFYLRLSENGKRKWVSFKNLTEALTAQANIETNLDRARKGIEPLPAAVAMVDPTAKGTVALGK